MIGGADVRGCEAAEYPCEASARKGLKIALAVSHCELPCQNDTLLAIYCPG